MTSGNFNILILTDSRDWIDELIRLSTDGSPHIRWKNGTDASGLSAEWGITAAAPAAIQEYAENVLPTPPARYDLQDSPKSFERYALIVSLHARQIFPAEILRNSVCVNLHPGLPHQRGWVPYSWAIMTDEPETGCTLHRMTEQIDRGYVYEQHAVPVLPTDTAGTVRHKIMQAECQMFERWFPQRINDLLKGKEETRETDALLKTQADWDELCHLNSDDLAVIRKLRATTFELNHSEAWFEADGTRYRVAINIFRDET